MVLSLVLGINVCILCVHVLLTKNLEIERKPNDKFDSGGYVIYYIILIILTLIRFINDEIQNTR